MRQTIECEACATQVIARRPEYLSLTFGFPLSVGYRCYSCNLRLNTGTLIIAVGIWCPAHDMPYLRDWAWRHLRRARPGEITKYKAAEISARELAGAESTIDTLKRGISTGQLVKAVIEADLVEGLSGLVAEHNQPGSGSVHQKDMQILAAIVQVCRPQ